MSAGIGASDADAELASAPPMPRAIGAQATLKTSTRADLAAPPAAAQSVARAIPDMGAPVAAAAAVGSPQPRTVPGAPIEFAPAYAPRASALAQALNISTLAPAAALPAGVAPAAILEPAGSAAPEAAVMTDSGAELPARLVAGLRMLTRAGGGEATIRLRPEHLGEVRIEVRVERGQVAAVIHAERADVRAQIEQHSAALRTAISEQGLRLEQLSVREDARRDPQRRRDAEPRGRPPRRADPERRFEVRA
jgi:flagellar hook-length control protein FliK